MPPVLAPLEPLLLAVDPLDDAPPLLDPPAPLLDPPAPLLVLPAPLLEPPEAAPPEPLALEAAAPFPPSFGPVDGSPVADGPPQCASAATSATTTEPGGARIGAVCPNRISNCVAAECPNGSSSVVPFR